ncbi:MAG: hypothetical protein ACFE9L_10045 [Candidatus Hodarchaeota archaeon]
MAFRRSVFVIPLVNYQIFTDFKGQIDESILGNYLNISESLIRFSNGDRLTREGIKVIQEKFKGSLDGTLFPGGKDTIFAWSIPFGTIDVLLKPYYKKELFALIIHYLSVEEFGNTRTYNIKPDLVTNIVIPTVIGVANIAFNTHPVPLLITTESKGDPILNNTSIVTRLGEIAKKMAYDGFIVDLYPSNWRLHPSTSAINLEYIDLIISKKIDNVKSRVYDLIKDLNGNT